MKKIFYTILAVALFSIAQISNAQINLEHTFNGNVTYGNYNSFSLNLGVNLYARVDTSSNQLLLYNEDYSLYKAITIVPPTGYNISHHTFLSKNLFNSDNKLEFIITFFNPSALQQGGDINTYRSCKMYNEDGNLIKDFGTSYLFSPNIVKISNEQFKLIILRYIYYYVGGYYYYQTDIYSVPGTVPNGIQEQGYTPLQPAYPNPANTTITLPYQLNQGEFSVMNIYNINGQLIDTKQIGYDFDKIILNVSNYTKGMYIYEVNGISEKFIVE